MKTFQKIFVIILFLTLVCNQNTVIGQVKKDSVTDLTPNLTFGYLCTSNDSVILTADLSVRRESGNFAMENAEIEFTISEGMETLSLGKIKTGETGIAVFKHSIKSGLPIDKEGKTTFSASFAGKGKYLPTTKSITVKQARLLITFTKEDSLRTIHVKAIQVEGNKEMKPLPKETVIIYVPRMLSNLKIGEITLDDNGMGSIEYPGALVGDSLGNIMVIAMIEENEIFGTVKGQSTISWGIPKQYYLAERPSRELWTPVAPIWMIITLIIMLTGVWAHYIYAVVQLVMIKRHKKQDKNIF